MSPKGDSRCNVIDEIWDALNWSSFKFKKVVQSGSPPRSIYGFYRHGELRSTVESQWLNYWDKPDRKCLRKLFENLEFPQGRLREVGAGKESSSVKWTTTETFYNSFFQRIGGE